MSACDDIVNCVLKKSRCNVTDHELNFRDHLSSKNNSESYNSLEVIVGSTSDCCYPVLDRSTAQ